MHQVLSYETSVRSNSPREFRDYVTRKTCITVVVAAALTALILGYFIGSLFADRKQTTRPTPSSNDNKSKDQDDGMIELSSADYTSLKELHAYQRIKDKLIASAQTLGKMMHQDDSYLSTSINSEIFNKYVSCTQDIPPNTTLESSEFIEQLVDNTAARQRDCMRIIQIIIDNNLANG